HCRSRTCEDRIRVLHSCYLPILNLEIQHDVRGEAVHSKQTAASSSPGSLIVTQPKVYIVIVNWKGWRDTIECLESVFRLDYPNWQVIVCDNGSDNDSIGQIVAWAEGKVTAECESFELRRLTTPPIAKPVRYRLLNPSDATFHGCEENLLLVQNG